MVAAGLTVNACDSGLREPAFPALGALDVCSPVRAMSAGSLLSTSGAAAAICRMVLAESRSGPLWNGHAHDLNVARISR
jgi:hypothetical protein